MEVVEESSLGHRPTEIGSGRVARHLEITRRIQVPGFLGFVCALEFDGDHLLAFEILQSKQCDLVSLRLEIEERSREIQIALQDRAVDADDLASSLIAREAVVPPWRLTVESDHHRLVPPHVVHVVLAIARLVHCERTHLAERSELAAQAQRPDCVPGIAPAFCRDVLGHDLVDVAKRLMVLGSDRQRRKGESEEQTGCIFNVPHDEPPVRRS